jgi:hypothetical protein
MRSWVLVGHVCNPNYLRDRDKKDRGLKPAQANSSGDLISSKPTTKKGGGMAQGVGPEFKSKYQKKKPHKNMKELRSSENLRNLFQITQR